VQLTETHQAIASSASRKELIPTANETTTTSANDVYTTLLDPMLLEEARPLNVTEPFFYKPPGRGNAFDMPVMDDPGAASASTEGTGLSNTQLTTSKVTASPGTIGQMATITDELNFVAVISAYEQFGAVLGRSVMEKEETDRTALLDDFSNTTSTSGIDLTVATFLQAEAALASRDQAGTKVAVLHTQQAADIAQDIITSTASYWANPNAKFNGVDANTLEGYVGTIGSTPIYQTSLIPTANSGADRAGAIFLANVAVAQGTVWDLRTELERDASLPGTEIVATSRKGYVERRDAAGQTLITDA
jgi:hypothetical protein